MALIEVATPNRAITKTSCCVLPAYAQLTSAARNHTRQCSLSASIKCLTLCLVALVPRDERRGLFRALARASRVSISRDRTVARAAVAQEHPGRRGCRSARVVGSRTRCGSPAQARSSHHHRTLRLHAQPALSGQLLPDHGRRHRRVFLPVRTHLVLLFRPVLFLLLKRETHAPFHAPRRRFPLDSLKG